MVRRRRSRQTSVVTLVLWLALFIMLLSQEAVVVAFGGSKPSLSSTQGRKRRKTPSMSQVLERCVTPQEVLHQVGSKIDTDSDRQGRVASLVLIRLSKLLITLNNDQRYTQTLSPHHDRQDSAKMEMDGLLLQQQKAIWSRVVITMSSALQNDASLHQDTLESLVEGTKAVAVISRILPELHDVWEPLANSWGAQALSVGSDLEPHQLSGLKWAFDSLFLGTEKPGSSCWSQLPESVQTTYNELSLPFRIRPNCLNAIRDKLSVPDLVQQVNFCVDDIRAASNRVVKERRRTAWEGDDGVANFEYSGKSMKTHPWSPAVRLARDEVHQTTGFYYDGCLVNMYPDGGSGMRYHIDPDQGVLWENKTAVVSIGATRRFAFRPILSQQREGTASRPTKPHSFTLFDGDVTEMFSDCQTRFQHTVKKAVGKNEKLPRASLVFKKTFAS